MAISFNNFFEQMSGMKKMSYGGDLYDPAEAKKLRKRKEKLYGDLGASRDRYGKQAGKFLDSYGREGKRAEKYYGAGAEALGRSETALRRGEADISRSRRFQRSADAMIGDRKFYGDLKKRSGERRKQYKDAMLEQQGLRGRIGKPSGPGALSQTIMDAFKTVSDSAREQMAPRMAEMRKTNPVAAAKMMLDFDKQTMQGLDRAKQKGFLGDRDINMQNLAMEEGMLMRGTGMLGAQAQEDQYISQYQQQQIANYGAAGTQALQTAGQEQQGAGVQANIARGQMAIGGQYDQRARDALGAGMNYEGMGYGALQDQTSMTRADLDRQAQFQLSDRAARSRVDQFNAQRRSTGLSNVLKLAEMGIGGYGALQGAALNKAQADYYKSQTPGGSTGDLNGSPTGRLRNVDFQSVVEGNDNQQPVPTNSNSIPYVMNNYMRPSSRKSLSGSHTYTGRGSPTNQPLFNNDPSRRQTPAMSGQTPYQEINHDVPSLSNSPSVFAGHSTGNKLRGKGEYSIYNQGSFQPWGWIKQEWNNLWD